MFNKQNSLSMWLKSLEISNKKNIDLNQLKLIAKKLDLLNFKSFIFTVAGTNGKGTTCAILEKLFLTSGYQVGLYTSPHLISYLERVRINGAILTPEEHISSFKEVDYIRKTTVLTYFEFITLSALTLFKRYSLDIIILEVGLGGRLDATNIIDPNLSIITNIRIDHTNILGKNRSLIAREKSGIFRKNIISVIGETDIPDSMNEIAQKKQAILKKINVDYYFWKKNHYYWNFIHSNVQLYNLPVIQIPLSNVATALSAAYYTNFKINEQIIREAILSVQVPGRFQVISSSPKIILDVAHNPDAALYLSEKIDEMLIKGKIYAVIGMFRDKDISGTVFPLKTKIDYWYASPLKNSRTATVDQLKNILPINNTFFSHSIHETYKKLCQFVKKEDAILVFGSFITVAEFIMASNVKNHIISGKTC